MTWLAWMWFGLATVFAVLYLLAINSKHRWERAAIEIGGEISAIRRQSRDLAEALARAKSETNRLQARVNELMAPIEAAIAEREGRTNPTKKGGE